jgi:hypothetical protein
MTARETQQATNLLFGVTDMPAFRNSTLLELKLAIEELHIRMQQTNMLEMSHQELLDMFVPKGDHEVLLKIRYMTTENFVHDTFNFKYSWSGVSLEPYAYVDLRFAMHDTATRKHPALPKHRSWTGNNPEAEAKIDNWLQRRFTLGVDYSRVNRVLEILNERCSSPQQIKFLWPSIMSLCKMRDDTRQLASAMEAARTPHTIPALSPELRQACRKTAGAIAVANLLGEPPDDVTPEVTIACAGIKVTEEGLGTWTSF